MLDIAWVSVQDLTIVEPANYFDVIFDYDKLCPNLRRLEFHTRLDRVLPAGTFSNLTELSCEYVSLFGFQHVDLKVSYKFNLVL